jgi:hypothetical protein
MSVFGSLTLGKPLPLRPSAFNQKIVPIAEVLPEAVEKPQFYSIKVFGQMADMSRSSVNRAIRDKKLKAKKRGRRTVISYEDAMAYMASLRPVDSQIEPEGPENGIATAKGGPLPSRHPVVCSIGTDDGPDSTISIDQVV